jgi:hypothetical protein
MRSLVRVRLSLATLSAVTLGVVALQSARLELIIPLEQLRLAWTLTRVLVQL